MKKILQTVLVSKDIKTDLPKRSLRKMFAESDGNGFSIRKINDDRYKFLANFSLGTVIVKGSPGFIDGISVYGKLFDGPNSATVIRLTTELRIELIVILIFWVGMIFFQLFGPDLPLWINLILFPILILWFGFIYRIQEKSLLKKVEKKIKTLYNNGEHP